MCVLEMPVPMARYNFGYLIIFHTKKKNAAKAFTDESRQASDKNFRRHEKEMVV